MWNCCKQCGALLEDDAIVCPYCGKTAEIPKSEPAPKPVSAPKPAAVPNETPVKESAENWDPIPKFSLWIPTTKQKLIIAGILLAVIVIAVSIHSAFFTPARAVAKYEAVLNGETEQLRSLAPDEYWETHATANGQTINEYIAKQAKILDVNYAKDQLSGSKISAKLTVQSEKNLPNLQTIRRNLESTFGINKDRIKDAKELTVQVRVNGRNVDKVGTCVVTAVQIDASWYLLQYNQYTHDFSFIVTGTLAALRPNYNNT